MTRILLIDDEALVRDLMTEILERSGYDVVTAGTASEALECFTDEAIRLVVSDIIMPGLSGLELLEAVRLRRPSLPVVLVTGADTYDNLSEALTRGADGLVTKPFTHEALRAAVEKALERAGRSELELRERLLTPTLASALANAIEEREATLRGHCERLTALALRFAHAVGLEDAELATIRLGATLHDIGKIGIPDRVLLKPGGLDDEEFALMRTHTVIGDRLLEPLDLLANVRAIVRHHHERWDGRGYPDRLAGEEIPIGARIVALADSIEAMGAHRVYRAALPVPEILVELRKGRRTQWDPRLVDIALALIRSGAIAFGGEGVNVDGVVPSDLDGAAVALGV